MTEIAVRRANHCCAVQFTFVRGKTRSSHHERLLGTNIVRHVFLSSSGGASLRAFVRRWQRHS